MKRHQQTTPTRAEARGGAGSAAARFTGREVEALKPGRGVIQ